jgi:glycolate oxidase
LVSEDERRAFETDGLTAYRQMPLAVVLPSTTAEVESMSRTLVILPTPRMIASACAMAPPAKDVPAPRGVRVVPRGAGTSLAGGAIAQADAIILGVGKMTRVARRVWSVEEALVTDRPGDRQVGDAALHPGGAVGAAEVAAVMAYCHANGVRVVPRGAGTSLAGGAIAQPRD